MKLYLVRHATPVSADVDPERPLSDEGRAEAQRAASALGNVGPVSIYHSGKPRAEQTAQAFSEVSGAPPEQADGLKPNDDPAVWAARLKGMEEDVMLVGHLPYMARLVGLLLSGDPENIIMDFAPGTVACLEFKDGKWGMNKTVQP